ncbi:unnamed protein product, partial [Medioppia subpectinata]
MELKVWCDGIQRVVCGVSAATTCQEVVFALAHATGQTGRFILIEKFRHQSERLLAPTEHPLLVLSHWGEYATDVQFVMKRSDGPVVPTGAATASAAKLANTGLSLATSPQQHSISSPAVNTSANGSGQQQQVLVNGQPPPPALVSPNRRDVFNNSINRKSGHRLKSDTTQLSPSMAKQLSSAATTTAAAAVARNGNTGSASTPTSTHTIINSNTTSSSGSTSISTGSHPNPHHHSIPGSAQPLTTASPVKQQVPPTTTTTANTNSISSHNNNHNNPIITSNAINANNQLVNNINHMNANMVHNNHNNNNHHSGDQLLTESAQLHQKFIAKNNTINNIHTINSNSNNANNNNNNTIIAINNTADAMVTSPKGTGHRPRHPPPYSEAINKSALVTGGTGSPVTTTTGTGGTNTSQHPLEFDSSSASDDNNTIGRQVVTNTTTGGPGVGIGGNNKRRSAEPSPQTQSKQRTTCDVGAGGVGGGGTGSQKDLLLHRDAIRLVDMQKETMRAQEMEMSSVEREITLIEKNLMDNELLISEYKCEMEAVHQRWQDQEVVIEQMDGAGMECELDELVARAASYEDDVQAVKHKLSQCETQIGDCRQQITRLMDQLEAEEAVARRQRAAANEAQLEANDETERLAEQLVRALRDRKDEFESQ